MISLLTITDLLDSFFLYYFGAINLVYLILVTLGSLRMFLRNKIVRNEDIAIIDNSTSLPYITFILPALNEEKNIKQCVNSLKEISYPYKQIIVINDESKDKTLDILKKELKLFKIPKYFNDTLQTAEIKEVYLSESHPEFTVIDKKNGGGKYDALNAGINASKSPYFIVMDTDTVIDNKCFLDIIRPLLAHQDTIAVGTTVKILNGCEVINNKISTLKFPQNILSLMQNFEYLRSFIERQGWDSLGGNLIIAGAFSIFRKEEVIKAGGYANTVAEDMEIIVRLHRVMKALDQPYKIFYLPDPVAWTTGPETIKDLKKQRARWQKGVLDSLWFHKKIMLRPKNGMLTFFVYPFFVIGEALEPIVEFLGTAYIIIGFLIGIVKINFILIFLVVTLGFNIVFTTHCIVLEEFFFRRYTSFRTTVYFVIFNLIEKIGYRQVNIFWRICGCWDFIKDFKNVLKESKFISSQIKKITKGAIS